MIKPFILFDFDGVIADSFKPAFEVNRIICPQLTEDDYRKRFEGNINDWESVVYGHNEECRHDVDFFAEYIPKMKSEVSIVNGMQEVIKQLSQSYTLVVISSMITSSIQEFMKNHNLMICFVEIMGNDIHIKKTEKIKMILKKYMIVSERCVFITDTLGDMREASQMEVGSIGVSWGFHKPETLIKGEPFRIVEKPIDLPTAVKDYFSHLEKIL